ncbi:MAG: diaminopimelate decarboxylase, partial [Microcella sp.]|nr:diaminopimelate decarboxylase [Microcella sp.]
MLVSVHPLAPSWLGDSADAHDLAPQLWPATARRDDTGALTVGGVSARDLAAHYGTPLYVVDEADARDRASRTLTAFTAAAERHGTTATVYYAGKAFLSAEVARWMSAAGLNIDVASGGELA